MPPPMPLVLLLTLLSWSSAAFGADTPAAVEDTLPTPADVTAFVKRTREAAGAPVLLAAAGPEAERTALKVAEAMEPGQVRVVRIGYEGTDEMHRALATSGVACGVRLATTSAGAFTVARYGRCEAAAPGAAPAPAETPVTAAPPASHGGVSSIPGVGAALPGVRTESAPPSNAAAPLLQPLAPPPPPDPAVLQSTYDLVALKRVDNPAGSASGAPWVVRDGRGRTLDALDFARRTGDLAGEKKLTRETKRAKTLGLGLALGGGALTVAGLGLLVARQAGEPEWSTYEPDITSYDSNAEYFEALAQAEADFRAAEDAHAIRADDRAWIAGFLAGAGVMALGASPFAARGAAERRELPALYWDPTSADALIAAHNASVRQRIGLPEEKPPEKVIVTPPPSESEDDDLDLEPPEDAPDGAPEAPPEAPAPAPEGPSGRLAPGLHLTPVLGFGWTGVTGTF